MLHWRRIDSTSFSRLLNAAKFVHISQSRSAKFKPFRPPLLNDLPLPRGNWKQNYQRNQKRYNRYLAFSSAFAGVSLYALFTSDDIIWALPNPRTVNLHSNPEKSNLAVANLFATEQSGENVNYGATVSMDSHEERSSVSSHNESESLSSEESVIFSSKTESSQNLATGLKGETGNVAANSAGVLEKKSTETEESPAFPTHVPYLLIGAGTASFSAFRSIKNRDPKAKVLIIGDEPENPYMRPPLSKEFWYTNDKETRNTLKFKQWNNRDKSIFYEAPEFFCNPSELAKRENGGVAVASSLRVVKLDVERRIAHLNDGSEIGYDKCLIATGARPRRLHQLESIADRVTYFRNIADYRRLAEATDKAKSVVVVGGGFLGSELACSLAVKGSKSKMEVIQTFPEKGNLGKVLPDYLSRWTTEKLAAEGVRIVPETQVTGAKVGLDGRVRVTLDGDRQPLVVDHVVVAVGAEANTDLAATSLLEVDSKQGGFRVNAELEARSNVWVAGDAANFYDLHLGRRRVEHHDHAVVSGRLAGENMTDAHKPYTHQSMLWSDLGPEIGFEAIGLVDSSLPTVAVFAKADEADTPRAAVSSSGDADRSGMERKALPAPPSKSAVFKPGKWNEEFGKGVVFYTRDNAIVGVVLWNVFSKMRVARQIIREKRPSEDIEELSKLFDLYDNDDDGQ